MKISWDLWKTIIAALPSKPPEVGGILGGIDGVITQCHIDKGEEKEFGCHYAPNVAELNEVIQSWVDTGIDFLGIFHTHFGSASTLSDGDKNYIYQIMQAIPESIAKLYFPLVVFPEQIMVPYLAQREGDTVKITEKLLEII